MQGKWQLDNWPCEQTRIDRQKNTSLQSWIWALAHLASSHRAGNIIPDKITRPFFAPDTNPVLSCFSWILFSVLYYEKCGRSRIQDRVHRWPVKCPENTVVTSRPMYICKAVQSPWHRRCVVGCILVLADQKEESSATAYTTHSQQMTWVRSYIAQDCDARRENYTYL
jgi:hypothetical protein